MRPGQAVRLTGVAAFPTLPERLAVVHDVAAACRAA